MTTDERLEPARRGRWRLVMGAVLVVAALAAVALWWTGRGFDVGDSIDVDPQVAECGYLRVDAGGEQWQSEEPDPGRVGATFSGGTLERLSENEAVYRDSEGGVGVPMQRIRSGLFWPAGCPAG